MRTLVLSLVALCVLAVLGLFVLTALQSPSTLVDATLRRDQNPLLGPVAELVLQHVSRFDPNQDDLFAHTVSTCDGMGGTMDRPRCYAIVGRMLERGAKIDQLTQTTHLAPLHESALSDDSETMSFLLEHHASPNTPAGGKYAGMTPLGFVHLLQTKRVDATRSRVLVEMAGLLGKAGGVDAGEITEAGDGRRAAATGQ